MTNPRLEDHLVGLELQLVELVENKQRAEVQGREQDAAVLAAEITALQLEMASTAERIAEADAADTADTEPTASVAAPTAARAA